MLDAYLINQNKLLSVISVALFVSAVIAEIITFASGHPLLAVSHFIIILVAISCNVTIICKNKAYIKKWNAINEIDQSSFHYDMDGVRVMEDVGDLDFKFHRD